MIDPKYSSRFASFEGPAGESYWITEDPDGRGETVKYMVIHWAQAGETVIADNLLDWQAVKICDALRETLPLEATWPAGVDKLGLGERAVTIAYLGLLDDVWRCSVGMRSNDHHGVDYLIEKAQYAQHNAAELERLLRYWNDPVQSGGSVPLNFHQMRAYIASRGLEQWSGRHMVAMLHPVPPDLLPGVLGPRVQQMRQEAIREHEEAGE